jgi:hypothetical protein
VAGSIKESREGTDFDLESMTLRLLRGHIPVASKALRMFCSANATFLALSNQSESLLEPSHSFGSSQLLLIENSLVYWFVSLKLSAINQTHCVRPLQGAEQANI